MFFFQNYDTKQYIQHYVYRNMIPKEIQKQYEKEMKKQLEEKELRMKYADLIESYQREDYNHGNSDFRKGIEEKIREVEKLLGIGLCNRKEVKN